MVISSSEKLFCKWYSKNTFGQSRQTPDQVGVVGNLMGSQFLGWNSNHIPIIASLFFTHGSTSWEPCCLQYMKGYCGHVKLTKTCRWKFGFPNGPKHLFFVKSQHSFETSCSIQEYIPLWCPWSCCIAIIYIRDFELHATVVWLLHSLSWKQLSFMATMNKNLNLKNSTIFIITLIANFHQMISPLIRRTLSQQKIVLSDITIYGTCSSPSNMFIYIQQLQM